MAIIEAAEKDIDLLTRMNIELREDERIDNSMTEDEVRARMAACLAASYRAYLYMAAGSVCGYALVNHGRHPPYLRHFFIARGKRGRGYGTSFFKELVDYLQADAVDVDVLVWNERARRFYDRLGFYPRYTGLRYCCGRVAESEAEG